MKKNRKKIKIKNWLLCIRDKDGIITDIIKRQDYNILLMEGMERVKDVKGSWEIYDTNGNLVDGGGN